MLFQYKRHGTHIFHIFPRHVTLREKWINSIKRKYFFFFFSLGKCTVKSYSIFIVPQSKADWTSLLYSIASSVSQRKPPKICLPFEHATKRKKIGNGKSKILYRRCHFGSSGFILWPFWFSEKEKNDVKLENARMKQEIADMK